MARRKRKGQPASCWNCRHRATEGERFYRGLCTSCRDALAKARRAATGQRALDKAKTSTVERDGQIFTVKILPPKRRSH